MANPIFSKAGTPDVTLSQAPDLASSTPFQPRQTLRRFYNGGYKVLTRGIEDQVFNLIFSEIPLTDVNELEIFFQSEVVNFSERAFIYTDENSVSRQMRYLQSSLPGIPNSPTTRRLSMTLIVDNGPLD